MNKLKTITITILISLLICFKHSLLLSAQQETAPTAPPANITDMPYTDVNKKILNVGGASYHLVKSGDTIWGILIRENQANPTYFKYYAEEILKLNPQIKDINKIIVGDTIRLPQIVHKRKPKPEQKAKEQKQVTIPVEKAPKEKTPAVVKNVIKEEKEPPSQPDVKPENKPPAEEVKTKPEEPKPQQSPPPQPQLKKVVKEKAEKKPKETIKEPKKEEPKPVKITIKDKVEPKPETKGPKEQEEKPLGVTEPPKEKTGTESGNVTKETTDSVPASTTIAKVEGTAATADSTPKVNADTAVKAAPVIIDPNLENAIGTISSGMVMKGVTYLPLSGGEFLKLDNSAAPIVNMENRKVVLDYDNKIKKEDEEFIKDKFKYYDFVDVDKNDTDKIVVGKVLKASGYYSVREDKEIKIGKNVRLVIGYDWLLEKTPESFLNGDVKLVKVKTTDENKIPAYIKEYLQKSGFWVSEVKILKGKESPKIPKRAGNIVVFDESKGIQKTINGLLELTNIEHRENVSLKFQENDGQIFMRADFYFEIGTKGYVINLQPTSNDTKNLAEKYGVQLLDMDANQDTNVTMQNILNLLQKDYKYGTFRLLENGKVLPFLDVEVRGFLLSKQAQEGGSNATDSYYTLPTDSSTVFITYYPFPSTIERFVTDCGYKVIQK